MHYITNHESGASCSCGRDFSIWATRRRSGWAASSRTDITRSVNMVRGNAKRHADAANAKAGAL